MRRADKRWKRRESCAITGVVEEEPLDRRERDEECTEGRELDGGVMISQLISGGLLRLHMGDIQNSHRDVHGEAGHTTKYLLIAAGSISGLFDVGDAKCTGRRPLPYAYYVSSPSSISKT